MRDSFSEILKKHKLENNLTQREMANVLGISERMYILYEKGEYDGSEKRVSKYLLKLSENKMNFAEPYAEYVTDKPPNRIADLLKIIEKLEATVKDKEDIIQLLNERNKRAETIEKVFVSALAEKRTLQQFHNLIEQVVS